MVTFCDYRTPQKKERKEGQTKAFRKKKELLPSLLYKRSKSNHDPTKFRKERKKAVVCCHKRKRLLVWIAFLRIALLIHSFPERHI